MYNVDVEHNMCKARPKGKTSCSHFSVRVGRYLPIYVFLFALSNNFYFHQNQIELANPIFKFLVFLPLSCYYLKQLNSGTFKP